MKVKKKISPVKHCINFPLIISTFCSVMTVIMSEQSWILTNQGKNWPGWPLTFWALTNLPLGPLTEHWPPALPTLRGVVSSCWFVLFYFFTFFFFYYIHGVFCLSVAMAVVCGFSRAALEWRVRPKTVIGADSLWGNKPSHRMPQTPQHRLVSHCSHRYYHTFSTVCQRTVSVCLTLFVCVWCKLCFKWRKCIFSSGCGLDSSSNRDLTGLTDDLCHLPLQTCS